MLNLKFLENTWNTILSVSLSLAIIIAGFVIPPKFSTQLIEATIDYKLFSKFILGIFIALFLMPTFIYKVRKYNFTWWLTSVVLLIAAFSTFSWYYSLVNSKTAVYENERYVIGNHMLPKVDEQVKKKESREKIKLTAEEIIQSTAGNISAIWDLKERQFNSMLIIYVYIITSVLFALSALSAIQALFCTVSKK